MAFAHLNNRVKCLTIHRIRIQESAIESADNIIYKSANRRLRTNSVYRKPRDIKTLIKEVEDLNECWGVKIPEYLM